MLGGMRVRTLAAVVPLLLLGACTQDAGPTTATETGSTRDTASTGPAPAPSTGTTSAGGTQDTPALLDFTATTVTGEAFDGASLAGRPTVLWFWAPWCPTCRGQIPQVEALEAEYGDDLNVVGIGSLDSAEAIAEFADDVAGLTHIEDVDGELWRRFGVTEQSSFVVLDADGTVSFEAGYGGSDDLDAEVDSLLG